MELCESSRWDGGWAVISYREITSMSRDHIMVFADQGVGRLSILKMYIYHIRAILNIKDTIYFSLRSPCIFTKLIARLDSGHE